MVLFLEKYSVLFIELSTLKFCSINILYLFLILFAQVLKITFFFGELLLLLLAKIFILFNFDLIISLFLVRFFIFSFSALIPFIFFNFSKLKSLLIFFFSILYSIYFYFLKFFVQIKEYYLIYLIF